MVVEIKASQGQNIGNWTETEMERKPVAVMQQMREQGCANKY